MIAQIPEKTRRRVLGQVRTPEAIAGWMTAWACAERPRRILEPAVGDGVFIQSIGTQCKSPEVTGFEVDGHQLEVMRDRLKGGQGKIRLRCRHEDFITAATDERFDAVVANPPYVRHHAFEYGEAIWRNFDRQCGERVSRATNLYGLFLLRIWSLLAKRGRAAVITPAEWLNADFGKALKRYLLRENAIDAIVHFRPESLVFSDALTTASIILLRSGRASNDLVRLVSIGSPADLCAKTLRSGRHIRRETLDPETKWTPIFKTEKTDRGTYCRLGSLASCSRGIATGANDYFTLRQSDCKQWALQENDLDLCVTKAAQIRGDTLTREEVRRWITTNERVFLLNPRNLNSHIRKYLDYGRARKIDQRYLPSHRPVWYMPEQREPAPILISVFSRGEFKAVLNEAKVRNLTAYHGIYPRSNSRRLALRIHKFLNSSKGQEMIARQRRVYGGGLFKLEPRDVEAIEIPVQCIG